MVANEGNTATGASSMRYYVSVDAVKSSNDQQLSGSRAVPALAVGAQSSGTATVTLSATTPPGIYTLFACADATSVVTESNEFNNCQPAATQLRVALANLSVTSFVGVPPAAAPGASFAVTTVVHNGGEVTSGASTLRFYFSADTIKGAGDVLLSGKRSIAALGPGITSAGPTTLTPPTTGALGLFYVLACADDQLKVPETDENNCVSTAAQLLIAQPDLGATVVGNPPSSVVAGQSFLATDTVHNPSPVSAAKSSTRYYLSFDTTRSLEDVLLTGVRSVPLLPSGATSAGSRTVSVPSTTAPGGYYLLACADDTAVLTESNETNNCQTAATTVVVTAPGG
jgi:subtilase family serine protease